MATTEVTANLHRGLRALQSSRGWALQAHQQAVEPICLAIMALRNDRGGDLELVLHTLETLQNADGAGRPSFVMSRKVVGQPH